MLQCMTSYLRSNWSLISQLVCLEKKLELIRKKAKQHNDHVN